MRGFWGLGPGDGGGVAHPRCVTRRVSSSSSAALQGAEPLVGACAGAGSGAGAGGGDPGRRGRAAEERGGLLPPAAADDPFAARGDPVGAVALGRPASGAVPAALVGVAGGAWPPDPAAGAPRASASPAEAAEAVSAGAGARGAASADVDDPMGLGNGGGRDPGGESTSI